MSNVSFLNPSYILFLLEPKKRVFEVIFIPDFSKDPVF